MTIDKLFRPEFLFPNLGQVNIILKIWKGTDQFDDLNMTLPSYYTLEDIKREFFILSPDATRLPRFVFMGVRTPQGIEALDFSYLHSNKEAVPLQLPTKTIRIPDKRWASDEGEPYPFKLSRRDRLLIEDFFHKEFAEAGEEIPTITIYVYQLSRLLASYTGLRPISAVDWYRRIGCFFPDMPPNDEPRQEDIDEVKYITDLVIRRKERVNKINELIEAEYPTYPMLLRGIMRLRLSWKKAEADFESPEMFFYKTKVTHEKPFIRLLRSTGEPVNKIFSKGQIPIPDIADPELLRQWARDSPPKTGEDFVFLKNLIREEKDGLRAVYGTLRVFNDSSADYIMVPPKKERLLETNLDLAYFNEKMQQLLEGLPYNFEKITIGDASIVLSVDVKAESKITLRTLAKKLPCFTPFFQLIKPYVQDMPQIMLRYKTVSDFLEEGRVATYITYLSEKLKAKDDGMVPSEWIGKISEEFGYNIAEARDAIIKWKQDRSSFIVSKEEDIYEGKNPGVDIAIYDQHPNYYIHVYGIKKTEDLSRIITLLQLLFFVPEEEFNCGAGNAQLQKAQTVLQAERSPDAPAPLAEGIPNSIAAASVAAADTNEFAFDTDLMFDIGDEEEDIEEVEDKDKVKSMLGEMKQDLQTLQKSFAAASMAPQNMLLGMTTQMPAIKEDEEPPSENDEEQRRFADAPLLDEFFIALLKKNDPDLFDYKREGKQSGYARKCSATVDAQPLVLTYDQFKHNYETYINDPEVIFTIYPYLRKEYVGEDKEEYTFLRYGTDPKKDLYYTCPTIFCIRDMLIIRPKHFFGSTGIDGRPKAPNTCPFCGGLPITDRKTQMNNHTVVVSRYPDKHWVGFHRSDDHPKGFRLPCCFGKKQDDSRDSDKWMTLSNPIFDKQREWIQRGLMTVRDLAAEGEEDDSDAEDLAETMTIATSTYREERIKPYLILFHSMHNEYIQNPEKILVQGSLGLLPSSLADYFNQDNTKVAKPIKARQSLLPSSEGFLRVGIGNTPRFKADSLFLALAPLLGRTTLREVKQYLIERISPFLFVQMNYGNLVHEFFDPSFPIPEGGEEAVMHWAAMYLQIDKRPENRAAAIRIWKAYNHFIQHIISETETKELRIFGPILSHMFLTDNTYNGCLLIVLEYDVNNVDAPVQVLCPAYGVLPHAKDVADLCFIARTKEGYYEPIIYTKNRPSTGTTYAQHLYTLKWQRKEQTSWPAIVKQRVSEFTTQCASPGRTIYPTQLIDEYSLIGMSSLREVAINKFPNLFKGILRESYNHVAALLFSASQESSSYIAVPCVDDGFLVLNNTNLVLDWSGYTPAPIDDMVEFYKKYIIPNFSMYKGYSVVRAIKTRIDGGQISAARLENGLFIPAAPPRGELGLPLQVVDELQWIQDSRIAYGDSILPKVDIHIDWINELYAHFRLTFSNWLVREEQIETRRSIKNILNNLALANWQKWKRLDILLRSVLTRWMDDTEYERPGFSMLRKDCINITHAGDCTGVCKWVGSVEGPVAAPSLEAAEESGKCLIHVPKTIKKGPQNLSVSELFMFRLYDDLIRFPQKRDEIYDNEVSRLSIPLEAMLIGDQWIIPESSSTWTDLLRLEWAKEKIEKPKYFEEISGTTDTRQKPEYLEYIDADKIAWLGSGSENLYSWTPPLTDETLKQPYLPFIPIFGSAYEAGLLAEQKEITEDVLTRLAERRNRSIIVARPSKNQILIGRPINYNIRDIHKGFYLVIEEEGHLPALIVPSKSTAILEESQLPKTIRDDNRRRTKRPLIRK